MDGLVNSSILLHHINDPENKSTFQDVPVFYFFIFEMEYYFSVIRPVTLS